MATDDKPDIKQFGVVDSIKPGGKPPKIRQFGQNVYRTKVIKAAPVVEDEGDETMPVPVTPPAV